MSKQRITEIKTIKIDQACHDNPVFLRWTGTNGGKNCWLFHTDQDDVDKISGGDVFEPFTDDLEAARSTGEYIDSTTTPQFVVGADNLDVEDVQGIRGLLRAVSVEMLMNPTTWETDGPVWQTVLVDKASFLIQNTSATKSSIQFTINRSRINTQSQ